MTFRTLIRRSLRFHWRAHLGVVLGAAVGSAALIGALVVGDSVRVSLMWNALDQLGGVYAAMNTSDRFFDDDLLPRLAAPGSNQFHIAILSRTNSGAIWGFPWVYPAASSKVLLRLPGSIACADGSGRANHIHILGVDDRYFMSALSQTSPVQIKEGDVWLNEALARQLDAREGDELLLRVQKPSALPRDSVVASRNDASVVLRLRLAGTAQKMLSNLNLEIGQGPPLNAFIRRDDLARAVGCGGKANLLLAGSAVNWRMMNRLEYFRIAYSSWRRGAGRAGLRVLFSHDRWIGLPGTSLETVDALKPVLGAVWTLADAQVGLSVLPTLPPRSDGSVFVEIVELRTPRDLSRPTCRSCRSRC